MLDIGNNQIGDKGAQYVANALHRNIVSHFFYSYTTFHNTNPTYKTLTTLNLEWNQISDEGAEYLADALKNNRVSHPLHSSNVFSSSSFNADANNIESLG